MKRLFFALLCAVLLPLSAYAQSIRVIQIWDDVNNHNGIRPSEVPVTVSVNGTDITVTDSEWHVVPDGTINISQPDLPQSYRTSNPIVTTDSNGSTIILVNTHKVKSSDYTITNTLITADLTITKNADRSSPSDLFYFTVNLPRPYDYTTSTGATGTTVSAVPLHSGETATIMDIPVGTPYTVTESPDPRYTSSSTYSQGTIKEGGSTVTFTNILKTVDFKITKQWQGEAQGYIVLHLYADGEELDATFRQNGNTYTVESLPKYAADGHEIIYSAKEEYMDEYITMYINVEPYADRSRAIYNGGTIINRQIMNFMVRKEWIGVSEQNRPEITFQLYQNGKPITWRQPVYENGVYIWENLPATKDGKAATYYAIENPIDGYETVYRNPGSDVEDKALNGGIITNYKIPKTGDTENPLLLTFVALASAAGIVLVLLRKRR